MHLHSGNWTCDKYVSMTTAEAVKLRNYRYCKNSTDELNRKCFWVVTTGSATPKYIKKTAIKTTS